MSVAATQHVRPSVTGSDEVTLVASFLLAAAGLAHLSVAPAHFSEWWVFGLLFLVAAAAQIGFAVALLVRPSRALVVGAVAVSLGLILTWVVSRTGGLPFGPDAGAAEEIGLLNVITTLDEALLVALICLAHADPARGRLRRLLVGCEASGIALSVVLTLAFAGGVGHG